ncbi:hypothetical protein SEA_ZUCKER_32 [Arthrobacter phage Zucker]|nr:hypothetical protein SEA_ZUCKER_32 [Arthrobacter phage Zucker]
MRHPKNDMGHGIPEWNTQQLTEGQFLSEYRRTGRDGAFQAHLLQRHLLIAFHKMARPFCEPILRAMTQGVNRG